VNTNAVARHYDKLKPDERFRLAIEALARGDDQEADRLATTCPRKVYRMNDVEYGDRVRVSSEIVSAVLLDLAPRLGKLRMIEAFREFLPLFLGRGMDVAAMAWLDGYTEGKNGRRKRDDEIVEAGIKKALKDAELATKRIPEVLDEIRNAVAAEIKGIWEAFSRFSKRELRLEPDTVVSAWFAPALVHLHEILDALDRVQPSLTFVDDYDASLTKTWRRLVAYEASDIASDLRGEGAQSPRNRERAVT
jgi:hypothetical protein